MTKETKDTSSVEIAALQNNLAVTQNQIEQANEIIRALINQRNTALNEVVDLTAKVAMLEKLKTATIPTD